MGLHNRIRDEICRFLYIGGRGLKIESLGFLSDEADAKPADFLTILLNYIVNHHGIFFHGLQLILRLSRHFGWQEGTWLRREI